jgi:hypothetical protein
LIEKQKSQIPDQRCGIVPTHVQMIFDCSHPNAADGCNHSEQKIAFVTRGFLCRG